MDFVKQFTQELNKPNPKPERLALAIAGLAFPTLEPQKYLDQLDEMAELVQRTLFAVPSGKERARHFLQFINQQFGFVGNREHYYDPNNSFLNVVMERRTGLPIMLSLLCMAIGQRIHVDIAGIGFPGHFMVRYQDAAGAWLLDPFHGQVLDSSEATAYLTRLFGQPIQLTPDAYTAVSAAALAQRILNNLRSVYLSQKAFGMAARVMDYLLVFAPSTATVWRERGLLHHYNEDWDAAAHDLRRYFFLIGQPIPTLEAKVQGKDGSAPLNEQDRQLYEVLQKIEEVRHQIN
ncbi:MAG: transglutaminase-like domain-containing protein [Caldilineaceae bacterium]